MLRQSQTKQTRWMHGWDTLITIPVSSQTDVQSVSASPPLSSSLLLPSGNEELLITALLPCVLTVWLQVKWSEWRRAAVKFFFFFLFLLVITPLPLSYFSLLSCDRSSLKCCLRCVNMLNFPRWSRALALHWLMMMMRMMMAARRVGAVLLFCERFIKRDVSFRAFLEGQ